MAQTAYSIDHTRATAGMVGDDQSPIMSTVRAVETAAGIGLGIAVSYGSAEGGCVLGTGTTLTIGITMRSSRPGVATTNASLYAQYNPAMIMEKGRIWVTVSGAVTIGALVKSTDATGVLSAGTAGAGETQLTGAVFETAAADGELALVKLP